MLAAFAPSPRPAENALLRAGIGRRVRGRYEGPLVEWIPREQWEGALEDIGRTVSRGSWFYIGLGIPDALGFQPRETIVATVQALNDAYATHNQNVAPRFARYSVLAGSGGGLRIIATTPGPHLCGFDRGLLTASLRAFKVKAVHAHGTCRNTGDPYCLYNVVPVT